MTDSQAKPDARSLRAEDVIDWLRQHPLFLQQHPDAVGLLHPPKAQGYGKGVADFQHYMVQRLRADRDEVLETARDIVETSRANQNNQARFHSAILMLLDAQNFEEFIRTITIDFAAILNVDIVSIVVETDGQAIPHIDLAGVRAAKAGTIDLLMKKKLTLLEANIDGFEMIYGGGAGLVRSQALLRLNVAAGSPPILLAFGSREAQMFEDGQGVELLSFLGGVIERCFRAWLDLT